MTFSGTKATCMSWMGMNARCHSATHSAFANYGGRGIAVCEAWRDSFVAFLSDMGDRPKGMSLDRIDPNGNYELGNCRWATTEEQSRNKRNTQRIGDRLLMDVAKDAGLTSRTLSVRLQRGWPLEKALLKGRFWNTDSLPRAVAAHAIKKRSQTHCKHGHEFTQENVYLYQGRRHCVECRRVNARERARAQARQKNMEVSSAV